MIYNFINYQKYCTIENSDPHKAVTYSTSLMVNFFKYSAYWRINCFFIQWWFFFCCHFFFDSWIIPVFIYGTKMVLNLKLFLKFFFTSSKNEKIQISKSTSNHMKFSPIIGMGKTNTQTKSEPNLTIQIWNFRYCKFSVIVS